ncbi:MAG: HD-GYP domain-containing protein, partial [Bradyrhizobium sp.]|nr:HD-GYP domain-containing protein [Bradyrhizobium sp.]
GDMEVFCAVAGRLGAALARTDKVDAIQQGALAALGQITASLEEKDAFMRGHSQRVAVYARALAGELSLSAIDRTDLIYAARVHDLGKYGISDNILHKKAALTPPEYALVQGHPVMGQRLLEACRATHGMAGAVRHHHERADGRGYPDGLQNSRIPLLARILTVVDAFDSMTGSRPYRDGLGAERAQEEIRANSGSQFDGEVAEVFCERVAVRPFDELCPPGSRLGVGLESE